MDNARTTTTGLAALLVTALLAACGGEPGTLTSGEAGIQPPPGDPAPAVTLGLTAEVPAEAYVPATTFELAATLELRVVADWSQVTAAQAERLELRSPTGNVYFATVIPFTGATGSDRAVSALSDGNVRSVFVLQVAGTPIESYAMTGTWTATVSLDGADTSASTTFQLW